MMRRTKKTIEKLARKYRARTGADDKVANIVAGALYGSQDAEYVTDKHGRQVRVFTKDAPLTRDVARLAYVGNIRVIDAEHGLYHLGESGWKLAQQQGYVVQSKSYPRLYWITTKAERRYGLRPPIVGGVRCKFHPEPKR